MAFQQVVCEVIFRVSRQATDSEGRPDGRTELIGEYETEREAEQALADNGFTRKSWGWRGNYEWGSISRILREMET